METNFNFKSQICTSIEQSERLLALGLKKETADCALFLNGNNEFEQLSKFGNWEKYADMLPAWSLHRLIEMMPVNVYGQGWLSFGRYGLHYSRGYGNVSEDGLYSSIINCIEWLIKEGYFNKEYLEE